MTRQALLTLLLAGAAALTARADAPIGAATLPLFGDSGGPPQSAAPAESSPGASGHRAGDVPAPVPAAADESALLRRRGAVSRSDSAVEPVATTSSGWVRTTLSLAAVTGLILLLAWGYRAVMTRGALGALTRPRKSVALEVLARTAITARIGVCAVRFGNRIVLIGVGGDRLSALDVISDADAASRFAAEVPGRAPAGVTAPEFAALVEDADAAVERTLAATDADQRLLRVHGAIRSAAERIRASATGTR
ncbi:MAG: flagellar biosynthetic protein FliO [Planctomycetia bacterium]|nr:MAG: flagellar biosynthetic protein FliO [Planctomycetia bacterium]